MSHNKEREEKNCLNCNSTVAGRFCQNCGQENIEIKESFGHLALHFIYDITHFDGKLFETLKYLFTRPGFLSKEYMQGRRMAYLNPIKMYVFISAIFFLVFIPKKEDVIKESNFSEVQQNLIEEKKDLKATKNLIKDKKSKEWFEIESKQNQLEADLELIKKDTILAKSIEEKYYEGNINVFNVKTDNYKNAEEYEAEQAKLPSEKRHSYLTQKIVSREIELRNKHKNDLKGHLLESYFHSFPQIAFLSLPLFALILQLLYVRRKNFYYVNHLIYTIHYYCAMFVGGLILFGLSKTQSYFNWINWLNGFIYIGLFYYGYKSMRLFYGQSRIKTLTKYFISGFLGLMTTLVLFVLFFILSIFFI
jgi:hypothetical protein